MALDQMGLWIRILEYLNYYLRPYKYMLYYMCVSLVKVYTRDSSNWSTSRVRQYYTYNT